MILYIIKFFVSLDLKFKLLINYIKNHWFFLDFVYTENRISKELGVAAVDTIKRMFEEIELKDNKINVLEKELKDVNHLVVLCSYTLYYSTNLAFITI